MPENEMERKDREAWEVSDMKPQSEREPVGKH